MAAKGNARAQSLLEGPELPEPLEYLHDWSLELHGKSGVSMSGLAPLSYATIEGWSRMTGIEPDSLEVNALFLLDHTRRHPGKPEGEDG